MPTVGKLISDAIANSPTRSTRAGTLRKGKSVNYDASNPVVPDYFTWQGKIDIESMKEKFREDIMNNLKMAEQMGVFRVIKNLANDASMQVKAMQLEERESHMSQFGTDALAGSASKVAFPGYEEQLKAIEHKLEEENRTRIRNDLTRSNEEISNPRYVLDEKRMEDLHEIFEDFNNGILTEMNHELLTQLIQKSEVLAFMTKIEENRAKSKKEDIVE